MLQHWLLPILTAVSCSASDPPCLLFPCLPAPQSTRVLVTHQLQYLPAADKVVVLRDGRLAEQGGYQELLARGVDFHQFELQKAAQSDSEGGEAQPSAAAAALAGGSSGLQDSAREMQGGEEQAGAAAAAAADPSGSICAAAASAAVFTDVPLLDTHVDGGSSPATACKDASVAVVQQQANGHSGRASMDLKVGGPAGLSAGAQVAMLANFTYAYLLPMHICCPAVCAQAGPHHGPDPQRPAGPSASHTTSPGSSCRGGQADKG